MSLLGWHTPPERVHEKLERRANSLATPVRPVHWSWLHGPAERPDRSPGEVRELAARLRSSSAY